jgi:hypothetical protein
MTLTGNQAFKFAATHNSPKESATLVLDLLARLYAARSVEVIDEDK